MIAALLITALILSVGFRLGMRYNIRMARTVLDAVERRFPPVTADYVPIGHGVGYGFEYTLTGPLERLRGVLTTLPRYQVLYLPIARLLGRNDLLKLTFDCPDALPAGVATLVHETARRSRWQAVERDPDWREEEVVDDGNRFRLFCFNPLVGERMRSLVPKLRGLPHLNQISLDSRNGTITVFLTPDIKKITDELKTLAEALFFLTAPMGRVTVN